MRTSFALLVAWTPFACSCSSTQLDTGEPNPAVGGSDAQKPSTFAEVPPQATLNTCPTYELTVQAPASPYDKACEVEWFDRQGKRLRIDRVASSIQGTFTTVSRNGYDDQGQLRIVESRQIGVHGVTKARFERRWLPVSARIASGYGTVAAWSETNFFYDTLGRNTRETLDDGIDGFLEEDTQRAFHANGQLSEQWFSYPYYPREWEGPLPGGGLREHTMYEPTGALVLHELIEANAAVERTEWTSIDATHPLTRMHYAIRSGKSVLMDGGTYSYFPNGQLRSQETFSGFWAAAVRRTISEYDLQGHVLRLEEKSPGSLCVTASTYMNNRLRSQTRTCNGKVDLELTAQESQDKLHLTTDAWQIMGAEKIIAHTEDSFNACGAKTRQVFSNNTGPNKSVGTMVREWDYTATGKLLELRGTYNGRTEITTFHYDKSDRILALGNRTWTYDLLGRVASETIVTAESQGMPDAATPWNTDALVGRIQYRYVCTPD